MRPLAAVRARRVRKLFAASTQRPTLELRHLEAVNSGDT